MRASGTFLKQQPRWVWMIVSGVLVLLLLSLLGAPSHNWQRSGSTYSRSPDGYAAWYEFMENRGVPLQRSRQPLAALLAARQQRGNGQPKTLLQIQPRLTNPSQWLRDRHASGETSFNQAIQTWLAAGNNLIILGVSQPVRSVDFSSQIPTQFGPVTVETGRRASLNESNSLLADRAGAVVWSVDSTSDETQSVATTRQRGRLIFATTPHLGANAYQLAPGNYAFLADLVTQNQAPIIVDEYIHGYREPPSQPATARNRSPEPPAASSLLGYFAQTPLLPIAVQAIVLMLIMIWAKNQRFGRWKSVESPPVDNSTAYIQALAGALRQANSRSFVMQTVGQAELRQIQRQMGLGDQPLTMPALLEAWSQQQRSPDALKSLLRLQSRQQLTDRELLIWLQHLQHLRQQRP